MDYTNNPGVNKQPDASNYKFLAQLYGTVPGSDSVSTEEIVPGDRALEFTETEDEPLPEWLQFAYEEALSEIEDEREVDGRWRLLHESTHGRAHEVDLGGGYTLQVHKLLVPDN